MSSNSSSPLDVTLGLRRGDFSLALGVLFLSGGGPGGCLGGPADGLVRRLDCGTYEFFGGAHEGVDLISVISSQIAE